MKSDQLHASGGCQKKQITNSVIFKKKQQQQKQMTSFGMYDATSYVLIKNISPGGTHCSCNYLLAHFKTRESN